MLRRWCIPLAGLALAGGVLAAAAPAAAVGHSARPAIHLVRPAIHLVRPAMHGTAPMVVRGRPGAAVLMAPLFRPMGNVLLELYYFMIHALLSPVIRSRRPPQHG